MFQLGLVKTRTKSREDLGVELYGIQQELARHQMLLENNHDKYSVCNQERVSTEQHLVDIRTNYKKSQNTYTDMHSGGGN